MLKRTYFNVGLFEHTVLPNSTQDRTCFALNPVIQAGLTYPGGTEAELILMLVIYWDGLPVHRQSPVQVLTTW